MNSLTFHTFDRSYLLLLFICLYRFHSLLMTCVCVCICNLHVQRSSKRKCVHETHSNIYYLITRNETKHETIISKAKRRKKNQSIVFASCNLHNGPNGPTRHKPHTRRKTRVERTKTNSKCWISIMAVTAATRNQTQEEEKPKNSKVAQIK